MLKLCFLIRHAYKLHLVLHYAYMQVTIVHVNLGNKSQWLQYANLEMSCSAHVCVQKSSS